MKPKAFLLVALKRHGQAPVAESTLLLELGIAYPESTRTERREWLGELEESGHVAGRNDDLLGRQWALTPAGLARARELDR